MSRFRFLVADSQLPEIDYSGFVKMTVKDIKKLDPLPKSVIPFDELEEDMEVLYAESEESLGGLNIYPCTNPPFGLENYIKKKYVYRLEGNMAHKCLGQLEKYITTNSDVLKGAELWSLWFGADEMRSIGIYKLVLRDFENKSDILNFLNTDCCICLE